MILFQSPVARQLGEMYFLFQIMLTHCQLFLLSEHNLLITLIFYVEGVKIQCRLSST
jgi:hypothetical protein